MAAVMRRTWRFFPSEILISSHWVGIALRSLMGGILGQTVGGSIKRMLAGLVLPSFNSTPFRKLDSAVLSGMFSTCTQ